MATITSLTCTLDFIKGILSAQGLNSLITISNHNPYLWMQDRTVIFQVWVSLMSSALFEATQGRT